MIVPPPPALSHVVLDDGNASRVAITSITLIYTQPVTVSNSVLALLENPGTDDETLIPLSVANPSGDGENWVISFTTNEPNSALPDAPYALTVFNGSINDAFGQSAGADQTVNFSSAVPPTVTAAAFNGK